MISYEKPLDPPCDEWKEYKRPQFIEHKLQEICRNIAEQGTNTFFYEEFDFLYQYIEQNLENYLPKVEHDYYAE